MIIVFPWIIYYNVCHIRVLQLTEVNTEEEPALRASFCGQMHVNIMGLLKWFDFRDNECAGCMAVDYPSLITPHNICGRNKSIDTLLVISTSIGEVRLRRALRHTWLRVAREQHIGYVFVVGTSKNKTTQGALVRESSRYKDILQNDFVDDYRNLTIKTLAGLKWAVSNCPQVQYILKIDSDVLFNVDKWRSLMFGPQRPKLQNVMFGYCHRKPFVNRVPFFKRGVHVNQYPKPRFPSHCHGAAYGLSLQLAGEVVNISYTQHFIPLEDAYIGVCVDALGRKVYNPPHLLKYRLPELRPAIDEDPCTLFEDLYLIYDMEVTELLQVWQKLLQC